MLNLRDKAIGASEPIKHLVIKATDFSTYFSIFLANSKGKDKTIALFQYTTTSKKVFHRPEKFFVYSATSTR